MTNLYLYLIIIILVSGVVCIYTFKKSLSRTFIGFFMFLCFSLLILSIKLHTAFDNIADEEYKKILSKKEICYKYDECKKYFINMVSNENIKIYKLEKFEEILSTKIREDNEQQEWIKKAEEDYKKSLELERIKTELKK